MSIYGVTSEVPKSLITRLLNIVIFVFLQFVNLLNSCFTFIFVWFVGMLWKALVKICGVFLNSRKPNCVIAIESN